MVAVGKECRCKVGCFLLVCVERGNGGDGATGVQNPDDVVVAWFCKLDHSLAIPGDSTARQVRISNDKWSAASGINLPQFSICNKTGLPTMGPSDASTGQF